VVPKAATKAGCPIQAVFWLEWDTTLLNQQLRRRKLCRHYSEAARIASSELSPEGTAEITALTCLGCFSSKLPQNRHPERSASPIDRVTQSLWRGVEGPRRCLFYPCCSELFDHRSPTTGSLVLSLLRRRRNRQRLPVNTGLHFRNRAVIHRHFRRRALQQEAMADPRLRGNPEPLRHRGCAGRN
jgi:hypothetical protein